MKSFFAIIFVSLLGFADGESDSEIEITLLLLKHFQASFCIYTTEIVGQNVWPGNNGSEYEPYYTSVLNLDQVQKFMLDEGEIENRQPRKSLIVIKADNETFSVLRLISQKVSLSSAIWVMYSSGPIDTNDFDGVHVPFNCEFIYIYPRGDIYILTDIYQIHRTSDFQISSVGFWTDKNGLTIHEDVLYRRRKKLDGYLFPAIVKNEPPYILKNENEKVDKDMYSGYLYEVWKEIQYRINFDIRLVNGSEHDNVSLDLYGADFAVMPVAYEHSTLDVMDITHPIYESRSYLFGHRPGSELEWDSYLKPFDSHTWWVTLGWMISSSAAFAVLYKIAWNYGTSEREADYFIFTFSESLATVFRAMCMQGSDVTPRSISCRLLFLSIYLTALVVSSAFSAALFSLLTIPTSREPFNNFQQVTKNKAYTVGIIRDSDMHAALQEYISKFPGSDRDDIYKKIEENGRHPETLLDGLDLVCRNRMYVMVSELPHVLYELQNMTRDCQEKVMPAGPVLLKSFIGFGLRKGSPYKEIIDLHILMMRNEGIIARLLLNNWPPHILAVQATWVRVTLADISPILYMFSMGVLLAVIFLAAEKVFHFTNRKKHSAKRKLSHFFGEREEGGMGWTTAHHFRN